MIATRCRCCGAAHPVERLTARGVPVENSRLPTTADEAAAVARGDLVLQECAGCGFVQNGAFDPALVVYDDDYLADQSGSAYFREFADRIVAEIIDRAGVDRPRALEIGCGGGEFLERFCAASEGTGVGIDPVAPERGSGGPAFVRAEFAVGSGHYDADVVLCRHTLEHLPEVAEFLRILRAELGGRPDCLVYLEIPDLGRILEEGAFWDLYYEHCSYFDRDGLVALLEATGFSVEECRLDYGGQYLLAFARLGATAGAPRRSTRAVGFDRVAADLDRWRSWARNQAAKGNRVALWAASSKAVAFLSMLEELEPVVAVDINPAKAGRFLPASATPVCGPDDLPGYGVDTVVVMNPLYLDEIRATLRRVGVEAETVALGR